MGIEKQGSRGGNYVGGFLQMFDWNAKSRKKLFSSKSDIPEQSKQKKRCDGNLPATRFQMLDEDEIAAGSSTKGTSDYSCSSSVVDEDFCGTRAPGVVARLMGLDSLPKSGMHDPYSTPLFDSQSLQDAYSRTKSREYLQDQIMHFSNLRDGPARNEMESKYQKVIHRPIEKFQTEVLPPKSAKSIPITHHKLLSPIKSASFIPSKDAAHIMEAAARIIEAGPQTMTTKTKFPQVGSSSVPLRVRDLKEKAQAAHKPLKVLEGSQRKGESSAVKNLRRQSMGKSSNGSVDATPTSVSQDSEESAVGVKNKGKSISLALQAKVNVQKREGLNVSSSRSLVSQKESCEVSPNKLFKSQSTGQKSVLKKQSIQNGSSVLRQNNQKQNCIVDRGKLPSKCNLKGGRTLTGEYSSARQRNSSKVSSASKVSSRKLGSEVKDDKREVLSSSSERITRKKRSIDGNYHSEKTQAVDNVRMDKNAKGVQSSGFMDGMSSWDQGSGRTGTDIISFTFSAPMTGSGPGLGRSTEVRENCKIFSGGSQSSKRSFLSSDGRSALKFSFLGHNGKGSDALSTLLEQKLKELTHNVEFSEQKSVTILHETVPVLKATMNSTLQEWNKTQYGTHMDNQEAQEETSVSDSNVSHPRKLLDCWLPSPVSVLEHSTFTESWNSSDTAGSNTMDGSKNRSSIEAREVLDTYSFMTFRPNEACPELSDSASSTSAGTLAKRQEYVTRTWELEYVKEILCNIEPMFKDYSLGRAHEIINPHLFNQLESRKVYLNRDGGIPRINRRVLFDCVSECMNLRCRQYVNGGCKLWAKGLSIVRRKDRLAEEVYKEISGWCAVGDSMIDELVDKDMSNQHGRWLNYDIEAFELGLQIECRVLNSLIDEVVADMLVL